MKIHLNQQIWRAVAGAGVLLIMVVIIGAAIAAGNSGTRKGHGLQVVAAENFYGNIASQIGGPNVQVTSIITDPQADPHLYESSAKNAAEVGDADVVITNGVGYDDFMTKLLSNSSNPKRSVITAANVLDINSDGANPHLWYDIPKIDLIAQAMANSFAQKDPAHAADYQANLRTFDQSLQPLLATIKQIKQQYATTTVAYTEPVPGYLLQATGLSLKTPEGFAKSIEDGTDPSPADTTAMDALLTNKTARILFYNSQATSPVTERARQLALQAGIPVIGVTETMPANQRSYQSWQQSQLDQIFKALETKQ